LNPLPKREARKKRSFSTGSEQRAEGGLGSRIWRRKRKDGRLKGSSAKTQGGGRKK